MPNRWGIPKEVEDRVRKRDVCCVYCSTSFLDPHPTHKTRPTWEHIVNDVKQNGIDNIALCCRSCNSSKGAKTLEDWMVSSYCKSKGISRDNVAHVVKKHLTFRS